ncbi:MAG: colicin immunity domain-containing protein [Bacteroidota bacterium]
MVNLKKLEDTLHLKKYLWLLEKFVAKEVVVEDFEKLFLKIRSDDQYWLQSRFDQRIGKVLDTFFLDVDAYTPPALFEEGKGDINEESLRLTASRALDTLQAILQQFKDEL